MTDWNALAQLVASHRGPWGTKFPIQLLGVGAGITSCRSPPSQHIARMIYTTNSIESVSARLRKIIKTRGHLSSEHATSKLTWLALRLSTIDWGRARRNEKDAMNQFAIQSEVRFTYKVQ